MYDILQELGWFECETGWGGNVSSLSQVTNGINFSLCDFVINNESCKHTDNFYICCYARKPTIFSMTTIDAANLFFCPCSKMWLQE